MKICGIYKITSPSGRVYVGSSKDIYFRWGYYKRLACKGQTKLYNSLLKYGPENHTFEIIAIEDVENILKYEHILGALYNVLDVEKGLNLILPGYDDVATVYSQETRDKMSNSMKGKPSHIRGKKRSPETIEKIRLSRIGKRHSKETISKLIAAKQNISEETKRKMSESQINRERTSEEIENFAQLNIGRKHTEETKLKISLSHTGKSFTEEHRKNISLTKQNMSQETKDKIGAASKGRKHTPEQNLAKSIRQTGKKFANSNNLISPR